MKKTLLILGIIAIVGLLYGMSQIALESAQADIEAVSSLLKEKKEIRELEYVGATGDTKKFLTGEKKGIKSGEFQFTVSTNDKTNHEWIVSWESDNEAYTITDIRVR